MAEYAEHVLVNRDHWNRQAYEWVTGGERNWRLAEPSWGIWDIPERELRLLPDDMTGMEAIELGCGTAYVSAWMARRGARVVASTSLSPSWQRPAVWPRSMEWISP